MSVRLMSKRLASFVILFSGAVLLGNAARANEGKEPTGPAQKHAEAMTQGKNHEEARDAAAGPVDVAKVQARAKRHLDWLNKGATHEEARDATTAPVDVAIVQARVKRHLDWLNTGASHEQARADYDPN